jgi:hypothetical protein
LPDYWEWDEEPDDDDERRRESVSSDSDPAGERGIVRVPGEEPSDWEGKLGESSMGTQYAVGIMLTFLIIAFGLILTKDLLNADWYSGCCNTGSPDIFLLALWGGILMPLSGIWAAIYESKKNKEESRTVRAVRSGAEDHRSGNSEPMPALYGSLSSEGANQAPRREEKDLSYRGEYPKEKEE